MHSKDSLTFTLVPDRPIAQPGYQLVLISRQFFGRTFLFVGLRECVRMCACNNFKLIYAEREGVRRVKGDRYVPHCSVNGFLVSFLCHRVTQLHCANCPFPSVMIRSISNVLLHERYTICLSWDFEIIPVLGIFNIFMCLMLSFRLHRKSLNHTIQCFVS